MKFPRFKPAVNAVNFLESVFPFNVTYFLKGGFWMGSSYAGIALMRLLLMMSMAYMVSKEFYGQFQFIFTVIGTVTVFALPGMNTAITQSVAKGFSSSLVLGTKAKMRWALLGSLSLIGVAAYFKFFRPDPLWPVFAVAAALFPMYVSFTSVLAYYYGKENFRKASLYSFLTTCVNVVAVLVALFMTNSLFIITVSVMISAILTFLWMYKVALKEVSKTPVDSAMVPYGLHLTFMQILIFIAPYVDKLIIAFVAGFEGLAIYTIAMAIAMYLSISGKFINILLLPKLSREKVHHARSIKKAFWWIFIAVTAGITAFIFVLPWIMPILFSEKYVESIFYAQVAMLYLIFIIPTGILQAYFQARKRTRLLYAFNMGIGILNIVLLGILVPLMGIMGAVISKVALGLFGFVFLLSAFYLTTNIKSPIESS